MKGKKWSFAARLAVLEAGGRGRVKVKASPFFTTPTWGEGEEKKKTIRLYTSGVNEEAGGITGLLHWMLCSLKGLYCCSTPLVVDHTGPKRLFLRHGRQQQQQPQQEMIDKTRSDNTSSSTMRSAVLRDFHQRIKPVDKRKEALIRDCGIFRSAKYW